MAARRPLRPHPEQRKRLRDVVAAGTHGRGAPYGKTDRARIIAVFLQMPLDQLLSRLEPERRRRLAWEPRACRPNKSCALWEAHRAGHAMANRSASAATKRHFEAALQMQHFTGAACVEPRQHVVARPFEITRDACGRLTSAKAFEASPCSFHIARSMSAASSSDARAYRRNAATARRSRVAEHPERAPVHAADQSTDNGSKNRSMFEIARQRIDQTCVAALPIADGKAPQREQRIAPRCTPCGD